MPPTIAPYDGPIVTLYPSGNPVEIFAASGQGGSATNLNSMVALDDSKATITVNIGTGGGQTPTWRVPYAAPQELGSGRIRAWRPFVRRIRVTATGGSAVQGDPIFQIRPVTSGLTAVGQAFGWHECPVDGSTTERFELQNEYSFGSVGTGSGVYADGFWGFNGGSDAPGLNALTFATFHGFTIVVSTTRSQPPTTQSFEFDTVGVDVAYTPPNPGTTIRSVALHAEDVSEVDAATIGVPLDPDWGNEIGWTAPTDAKSQDSKFAVAEITSDGITPTKFCQTKFLRMRLVGSDFGSRAGLKPKQLRIPIVCAALGLQDAFNGLSTVPITPDQWTFVSVGELLLLDMDGNVLLKSTNAPLYGLHTFKIPQHGASPSTQARVYDACLDLSQLTDQQFDDIVARDCRVAVRFKLYAGLNNALDEANVQVHVNSFSRTGDTPTISLVEVTTETRDDRTGRLDRRQR